MKSDTTAFDATDAEQPPRQRAVAGHLVHFLGFDLRSAAHRERLAPIVVLGGAFQGFGAFEREVERFAPKRPVLLVDLPGQGQNPTSSAGLSLDDLADILAEFLRLFGVREVILFGYSYGGGIAHQFAARHPERCSALVMVGTARKARPEFAALMHYGLSKLEQGDLQTFATATVHNLLNLAYRQEMGMRSLVVKLLHRSLLKLPVAHATPFEVNTRRVLVERLTGTPHCRTLVAVGQYDHFIFPYEVAQVAASIPGSVFAVLDGCDHVAQLQDAGPALDLFEAFLERSPLTKVEGVTIRNPEAVHERRTSPRVPAQMLRSTLSSAAGAQFEVALDDISYDGCRLRWVAQPVEIDAGAVARLGLVDLGVEDDVLCWPIAGGLRASFVKTNFEAPEAIRIFVSREWKALSSHSASIIEAPQ